VVYRIYDSILKSTMVLSFINFMHYSAIGAKVMDFTIFVPVLFEQFKFIFRYYIFFLSMNRSERGDTVVGVLRLYFSHFLQNILTGLICISFVFCHADPAF